MPDARRSSDDRRAVALNALAKGHSIREVAAIVDRSPSTIRRWRDESTHGRRPVVSVWEEGSRLIIAVERPDALARPDRA